MHGYKGHSAEKSMLRQAIRHENADLKMPEGTDKLPGAEIADLTR